MSCSSHWACGDSHVAEPETQAWTVPQREETWPCHVPSVTVLSPSAMCDRVHPCTALLSGLSEGEGQLVTGTSVISEYRPHSQPIKLRQAHTSRCRLLTCPVAAE